MELRREVPTLSASPLEVSPGRPAPHHIAADAEEVVRMAGTYRHIRVNHGYEAWFKAHQGRNVRRVTEDVADDCRAGCPIDSGDLVESIHTRYPGGLVGVVVVGTDHWRETEYGSVPHIIRSHGDWSLHNAETGEYFGPVVHHPGTPEQPFMRPALYQRRRLVAG